VAFYCGNVRAFDELYAGSNLVKAREIFTAAIKHGLRIGPTIRQRTRVLDERPRKCAVALGLRMEKKLSDQYASVCDAELAALEARMITIPATLALEHVGEPQVDGGNDGDGGVDDVGELTDGAVEESFPCLTRR
jgi:hypothetical protein